ncbi:MAG: TauD/TfdA family dioxygenase [Acidimicrobiales bacterium]
MTFEVVASGQVCGAEVRGVDLRVPLDASSIAAIRRAWLDHKVLAFPDQHLRDHDLERITCYFGPFGDDPYFESIGGHPHVVAIHRAADETAPVFADSWHADWTFQEYPPDGTCLYGKIIPPEGGDTWFIDQQKALEAMPPDLRARLDGRMAVHSARRGYSPDGLYGDDDTHTRAMKIRVSDEAYATQLHPLIRRHPETGAATLYGTLGYIIGIDGLDEDAGNALLAELYAWQTREEFRMVLRWEADTFVMWDNRCVLHRATGGYDGHERLLHRTTIGYNSAVRREGP